MNWITYNLTIWYILNIKVPLRNWSRRKVCQILGHQWEDQGLYSRQTIPVGRQIYFDGYLAARLRVCKRCSKFVFVPEVCYE